VESGGDASATHDEGNGHTSYGLMQVLDDTATWLGLSGSPAQLLVPAVGIDYGVHYLCYQLQRYYGNVSDAVAAYNAGTAFLSEAGSSTYVNQSYVDRVLGWVSTFAQQVEAAWTAMPPVQKGLSVVGVALIAFFVVWWLSDRKGR